MPKGFQKGHEGYKPKGATSKTTKETKEILSFVVSNEVENMGATLEKVRIEDPVEYLKIMAKLLVYVVPKNIDATSNGETIKAFTWTINDSPTKDK
jgi:phosphopantetheine adenylyltransferase